MTFVLALVTVLTLFGGGVIAGYHWGHSDGSLHTEQDLQERLRWLDERRRHPSSGARPWEEEDGA